tara:strand:- start:1132 stop:2298 length:1167 start_codon:yes stop_codon:yes gene_type:complete
MKIKKIIGVDATFTPHGGSLGHLQEFLNEISLNHNENKIILYLKKENLKIIDKQILNKCTLKIINFISYGNFFRLIFSQFILPILVLTHRIDVLFCPGNFSPIVKTTKIKCQWIATVGPFCEDMYKNISYYSKAILLINKWIILFSGYTSNIVIHQAEYSKNLFEKEFNFNSKKQYLISCGKDNYFKPIYKTSVHSKSEILKISETDLLCVSHLYPYKNIELLILVFSEYKKKYSNNQKLFIVGKKMSKQYFLSLNKLVVDKNLKKYVFFTGLCSKEQLRFAYTKCKLFIFTSLCESSGYTLIEAMSCGASILAAKNTAIPFTCQNAAEYYESHNYKDLYTKLENLLNNDDKIIQMKKKSLKRASEMITYKEAVSIFLNIIDNELIKI